MPWVTTGGGFYNHGEADATPIITFWKPDKIKVTKYTPPTDPVSIIGIVVGSATLVQCVYDNATGLSATLTQTTFDTTTRADSAEILLTNATGTAKVVRGAEIRAKTITMLSGSEGYLNDKYVDYESIANNGEIKLEIGNNFIVTFAQVNHLADYHWKNSRMKRHLYTLSLTGCQSFFEPGEWYTALIGAVGTSEYIGGVGGTTVMCYNVRSSISAGGIGSTQVTFLEMYPGWGFDSNELARSIASGQFSRSPTGLTTTVASSTYMGTADFYCDGTADEVEINNAITYMAGKGGGTVQLTEGTFNVAASIIMKSNITLNGPGAVLTALDDSVTLLISIPSAVNNSNITNLKLVGRNVVNSTLATIDSSSNCKVVHNTFFTPFGTPLSIVSSSGIIVDANYFDGNNSTALTCAVTPIAFQDTYRSTFINNYIHDIKTSASVWAISGSGGSNNIVSNNIYNLSTTGAGEWAYGIYTATNDTINNIIDSNKIELLKANTSTNVGAIYINAGDSNRINSNICFNNGSDTGIGNTNGCNFYDGGTNTQVG